MDGLVTTFLAALLAEFGDKTQLLVAALAVRYGRPGPVLLGVAVAALANSLVAALGGVFIHDFITLRATSLLVALALVFAGVGGLIGGKAPEIGDTSGRSPFLVAAASFFVLELGDKTQFLTGALAARFDTLVLAAAGATAGVIAANVPAALLADRWAALFPMKPVRIAIAALFLVAGFIVAINAWRLI
jgi:putative Ca2+/H+ antiporter (TMEM165/GDT1 family)